MGVQQNDPMWFESSGTTAGSVPQLMPVKSDGGSSSYYDKHVPSWLLQRLTERANYDGAAHIKTEELIEVLFDNDFPFGTLFKSLIRAYGVTQGGGKAGNDLAYELNKVRYYADRIQELAER